MLINTNLWLLLIFHNIWPLLHDFNSFILFYFKVINRYYFSFKFLIVSTFISLFFLIKGPYLRWFDSFPILFIELYRIFKHTLIKFVNNNYEDLIFIAFFVSNFISSNYNLKQANLHLLRIEKCFTTNYRIIVSNYYKFLLWLII